MYAVYFISDQLNSLNLLSW